MSQPTIVPFDESGCTDAALETLLTESYVGGGYTEPEVAREMFRAAEVRARGTVLIARSADGQPVGTATAVLASSPAARLAADGESELHLLCVSPRARGEGVGRALVEATFAVARDAGARRMLLWTQPEMEAAQHLYRQLGFERLPTRDFSRGDRAFLVFGRTL